MTLHEMMHQIALLSGGTYRRDGVTGIVEIPLPANRKQSISGHIETIGGEQVGLIHATVGECAMEIDPWKLLELNYFLRYSRVALTDARTVVVAATFELDRTSVKECAPIIQEVAATADELERIYFGYDTH